LKLPTTAKTDEYLSAIKGMATPNTELAARVQQLETDSKKERAEALVATALGEGKISAAQKPWADEYAAKDPDGFAKWAATAVRVVPLGGGKPPIIPPTDGTLSAEEKNVAKLMGVDETAVVASKTKRQG
jgi:phage I-like protein